MYISLHETRFTEFFVVFTCIKITLTNICQDLDKEGFSLVENKVVIHEHVCL